MHRRPHVAAACFTLIAGLPTGAAEAASTTDLDLPPQEVIDEHKTYDAGPELQQTAGGGLIVNAFIMEGPVHVELSDRDSGQVLMEREETSLFPFELSRQELGIEPTQVLVRIFVQGELAHELELLPDR